MVSFPLVILLSANLLVLVSAQFQNCDVTANLQTGQSANLNHQPQYGSCRYKLTSNPNTFIRATCTYSQTDTTCYKQYMIFSRSGELDLKDGLYYCGLTSQRLESVGNEMVLALLTSGTTSGSLQCTIDVIVPTNDYCDCGWNKNQKIVGGTLVTDNEYTPFAALIDRSLNQAYCGSVVIQQSWVLTAAHCIDANPSANNTAVLVGAHNITKNAVNPWSQVLNAAQFIKHPGYVSSTSLNDVALIRTATYIRYTIAVAPACLPYTFMNNDNYFDGKSLVAVGFGALEYGGPTSNLLLKAALNVIPLSTCKLQMSNIDSTKMCTYANRTRDTCQKDSGGALYWSANLASSRQYAVAIVNYGQFCAYSTPSVNSRVTSYIGWIESTVGGFFCRKT